MPPELVATLRGMTLTELRDYRKRWVRQEDNLIIPIWYSAKRNAEMHPELPKAQSDWRIAQEMRALYEPRLAEIDAIIAEKEAA